MSRTQRLRQKVINQILDSLAKGHITSPLPSQGMLAETFDISRTTVRHVLCYLQQRGIISAEDAGWIILRTPTAEDRFDEILACAEIQHEQFEQRFMQMINQGELCAGDYFSELELAREAGVSPVVVREFLLRFSRYHLIENSQRGQWRMATFNTRWAENLFEFREMLETHALSHFMRLPAEDERWLQARDLLERHRQMRITINQHYRQFSELDRDFHALILSAADNVFFNQSLELISVIFHFHYQWNEKDLKQRNIVAIEEHIAVLTALICRNTYDAATALRIHLATAKQSMLSSLELKTD